jgi:hypothetical protein
MQSFLELLNLVYHFYSEQRKQQLELLLAKINFKIKFEYFVLERLHIHLIGKMSLKSKNINEPCIYSLMIGVPMYHAYIHRLIEIWNFYNNIINQKSSEEMPLLPSLG